MHESCKPSCYAYVSTWTLFNIYDIIDIDFQIQLAGVIADPNKLVQSC